MKNTKPRFLNLFMHDIHSIFRAWLDLERINMICHDLLAICMKRFEIFCHENQYPLHQFLDPLALNSYPNCSPIHTNANRTPQEVQGCAERQKRTLQV